MRLLLILFMCSVCHALPVGNPAEPSFLVRSPIPEVRWIIPLGNSPVLKPISLKGGYYGDFVYKPDMHTHAGILALNFLRIAEVFGTLGQTTLNDHVRGTGSIGARLTSPISCNFALGVEGQRFRGHGIDESQIGGGLAYFYDIPWLCGTLSPYLAAKHQRSNLHDREWGMALGATLVVAGAADLTVEGRVFDEQAVFVLTQIRF